MNVSSLAASISLPGVAGALAGALAGGSKGDTQFELRVGAFLSRELEVISYEGVEKLSTPYAYDVVFSSSVPVEALRAGIFGFPAGLSIQTPYTPRTIQGLAIRFGSIGAAEAELRTRTRRYTTRIVPRLWLLSQNRRYRLFKDKSAVEVACTILSEAGITPVVRLQRADYSPIPLLYQRGETDLEFLHHVLAVAGIFYYYEHASGWLGQLASAIGGASAAAGAVGGAAGMAGGLNVSVGGASIGATAAGGLGGSLGSAVSGALGSAGSAVGTVASALGLGGTLVLCDAARHTYGLHDTSPAVGVAADVAAGVGAALGSLGGSLGVVGNAVGAAASAVEGALVDPLSYDANGQASTASERIFSFLAHSEVRPKTVTLRDWSLPDDSGTTLTSSSALLTIDPTAVVSSALGLLQHGSLPPSAAGFLDLDAVPIAANDVTVTEYQRDGALLGAADPFADRALSQLRADRTTGQGATDCRRLAPGYRFQLVRHPVDPLNVEYLVTAIRTVAYAPDQLPPDCPDLCRTTFECVPASIDPRPAKPPPRAAHGPEPATVVGLKYGEVYCDSVGRILVRFHWSDPSSAPSEDDEGVCWVQWLERWAGDGFGSLALPRVGSEIAVLFPQQEGAQPLGIGQPYSRVNMPPFSLPREGSKVGIRSSVIGTPGYCELAFNDATGDASFRADRDLDSEIRRDARAHIHRDHRLDIGRNSDTRIAGNVTSSVGGDATTTVAGSHTALVDGDVTARIGGRLAVHAEQGIEADLLHFAPKLRGPLDLHVRGETRFTHDQGRTTDIGRDETTTVAGRRLETLGEVDTSVLGPCSLDAGGDVVFRSATRIRLCCGDTELCLTPNRATLTSPTIDASATKSLELAGAGPSLTLDDGFVVTAKNIALQSTSARLELSDSAKLTGSKVKLGQGSGSSGTASSDAVGTQAVSVRLVDGTGAALANATYQAMFADTMAQGTTDGSGTISLTVPSDLQSLRIVVWPSHFPEGPRVTYTVSVAPLGDASSLKGAQQRLSNLGYYHGPLSGVMNVAMQDALLVFQRHSQLPVTGELDAPTVSQLQSVHE